jgi:F-type H+-transporting ATPase subunit b
MEIVTQTELVSINATMIVQVLSFLIFLFLIQRVMFRPLLGTMDGRNSLLKQLQKEIKTKETELAELSAKMQKEAAAVKAEAFLESAKMETDGKQEAGSILKQTREETAAQQRKASDDIRRRIETIQQELAAETETLVAIIIAKVLERRSQT